MKVNELARQLKLTYSSLIKGYSKRYFKEDIVFLKHYDEAELGELEYSYAEAYNHAEETGLPTEKEKREYLIESGEWSDAEEEEYKKLSSSTSNKERQLAQIFLESQKKALRSELEKERKRLEELDEERREFTAYTCEEFARRKYGEVLATACVYKDAALKERYYTDEEIEFLADNEFIEIVKLFNDECSYFSLQNIKRIAVSAFFFNIFLYCKNNPFYMFGKPACHLTVHQLNLLSYGAMAKAVLEKGKTPPDSLDDIDELVKWYEIAGGGSPTGKGTGKATPKRETQASGLVGATKEELENFAAAEGGTIVDLDAELAKIKEKKGVVTTADFKEVLDRYK